MLIYIHQEQCTAYLGRNLGHRIMSTSIESVKLCVRCFFSLHWANYLTWHIALLHHAVIMSLIEMLCMKLTYTSLIC